MAVAGLLQGTRAQFAAQQRLGQPQGQQPQPGLITYSTKYDDLPADRQKELQNIQ